MRSVWTVTIVLIACQPTQPLQPSYFTQKKSANEPLDCKGTLACYDACHPLVEECMLACDNRGSYYPVQRARAVANCAAEYGCSDEACVREHCNEPYAACLDPTHPVPAP